VPKNDCIKRENVTRASQQLQVSEATIQNWLKSKLLKTLKPEELSRLKKKLQDGKINKLNKRANKRLAQQNVHFHPELLSDKYQAEVKSKLDAVITKNFKNKIRLLMATYLNLLEQSQFVKMSSDGLIIQKSSIANELADWPISLQDQSLILLTNQLKQMQVVLDASVLAYTYQSASTTGEKNIKGAYYTPISLIRSEIKEHLKYNQSYCDPCCGGGAFLVEAYAHLEKLNSSAAHELVYGYDLDKTAVLISRANLTLLSKGKMNVLKQVRCVNAITTDLNKKFDVIATNPPWGAQIASEDLLLLQKKFPEIKSQESFSYFLIQSLAHLKANAVLSFILPESILNIKTHHDVRSWLLNNYKILSVKEVSEKFSGVMTKVVALRVENSQPSKKHQLSLIVKDASYRQTQLSYLKNKTSEISLNSNSQSYQVLSLIEKNAKSSLKQNAEWGLGVVTGNNQKYLKAKASAKTRPVLKGVDVGRFQFLNSGSHLLYEPTQFQQMAPSEKYAVSEKLIYRFICKELVFAIDRKKRLTLNSANFLVPKLKTHSIETLCALLNSKLAQYYFQKKFNTFKVLRYHLESFPIANFTAQQATEIDFLVRMLEKQFDETKYDRINQLVYESYKLDKASIDEIEKTILSKAFIK
jgi:type I restriction-modification system DNA methylase subunit